jgi:TRAP-type C4-dicarboxylate transport system substrate-binding protein
MSLVLSGCGSSSTGSTGGNTSNAGAASGGDDTVYTLKMNVHTADMVPPSIATKIGCDKATELSDGRLQFDIYYSGNYVPYLDTFVGLSDDTIDMAMIDATMIAGSFTLNQAFSKPIKTGIPPRITTSEAYRTALAANPQFNEELSKVGVRWVSVGALAGYNIHMKSKVITTPDDLKGQKLDSLGDAVGYFTAIGAPATALDPGDSYQYIEKNLVDGQVSHWALLYNFDTLSLLNTHTIFGVDNIASESDGGLYAPLIGYAINESVWNSLPADLQDILVEAFDYAGDEMARMDEESIAAGKKVAVDRGDEFVFLTGDALKPWYDWADKTNQEWFDACAAAGYDGEAAYNAIIAELGKK